MSLLKSSLTKKYWMALTGLFLCLFLVGHLLGNLQLVIPHLFGKSTAEVQIMFNDYAEFMTTNILVKIMSYITYISILFHVIDGFVVTAKNRKARPKGYAYNKPGANSSFSSRFMAVLGTIILVFLIIHLWHFWFRMHWGPIDLIPVEGGGTIKDLYSITVAQFKGDGMGIVWMVAYLVSMLVLAFHLSHGFQSAFQSLGIRHAKYTPIIVKSGIAFAIVISLAFAIIPVYVRFML